MRSIGAIAVLALCSVSALLAQSAAPAEIGITGRVLRPDGEPAAQGSVVAISGRTAQVTASIDKGGFFRVVPSAAGEAALHISVPGFAPYRASVMVPPSRIVRLPPIALQEATYLRMRLVSHEGQPLDAGGLRRRSVDLDGIEIPDPLGHTREHADADGSISIGPLPSGKLLLAYDRPPLARTCLPDVTVAASQPLIDRGVIAIQPGGQLRVEIRDGEGLPVAGHDVWIEEAAQPSILFFSSMRTNPDGHAVFDRLATGRYRVWTRTADRCGGQWLSIARQVSSSGSGITNTRLVIGGRALVRITSAIGPVAGRSVSVAPEVPSQAAPWQPWLRGAGTRVPIPPSATPGCRGATDGEGRLMLDAFPPGPANLRVDLFNATYVARVNVPSSGQEIDIVIPDGHVTARVVDGESQRPIGSARVVWTGGAGRLEASATANGDVLLEGAGTTGGTLAVSAGGYQPLEGTFAETPGTPQEIAMTRLPPAMMRVRVVADGKPLPEAVIEWNPRGTVTFTPVDASGIATLMNVPPGTLHISAHAEGFKTVTISVVENARESAGISMTLSKPR